MFSFCSNFVTDMDMLSEKKTVIITKEQKGKFNPVQHERFYVRSMHGAWGGA